MLTVDVRILYSTCNYHFIVVRWKTPTFGMLGLNGFSHPLNPPISGHASDNFIVGFVTMFNWLGLYNATIFVAKQMPRIWIYDTNDLRLASSCFRFFLGGIFWKYIPICACLYASFPLFILWIFYICRLWSELYVASLLSTASDLIVYWRCQSTILL